jgi:hypothetical protein
MIRNIEEPARDEVPDNEREFYDAIIGREQARGQNESDEKVGGYFGALMNSPVLGYHLSMIGRYVRAVGDRSGSFSHADREWVDQVLSKDWDSYVVLHHHLPDALAVGVRMEAIMALREGREDDLTADERLLTDYIRMVRDGSVTNEAWQRMAQRMTQRGAVEYTIFIMFLNLTIRLIEAFTGDESGASAEEVDEMLREFQAGTRSLPTPQEAVREG